MFKKCVHTIMIKGQTQKYQNFPFYSSRSEIVEMNVKH